MVLLIIGIVKKELNVSSEFLRRINNWTIIGTDNSWLAVFIWEKFKKIPEGVPYSQNRKLKQGNSINI